MASGSEKYAGVNRARKGATKSGSRKIPKLKVGPRGSSPF